MRAFLHFLDRCTQDALREERKRYARANADKNKTHEDTDSQSFGKVFGEGWRATYQKWLGVPAVNVAPAKFEDFCKEILRGRISDRWITELRLAYRHYCHDVKRLDKFSHGRIHWSSNSARQALNGTLASNYLGDLQRDPHVVHYVTNSLLSAARQSGNHGSGVSHMTELITLVASSKYFTDANRSHALYELARVGGILAYQIGNTQLLTWCSDLAQEAQEFNADCAHTSLRLTLGQYHYALEIPNDWPAPSCDTRN